MRHNYGAIGGRSPLTDITEAQAAALRARLGPEIPVAVGMRNWQPFIKDALARTGRGRRHARHRHPAGAAVLDAERAEVHRRRDARRCPPASRFEPVESFHAHPLLLDAFAERVRAAAAEARRAGRLHGAQPAGSA